jgi:hypothetical protein
VRGSEDEEEVAPKVFYGLYDMCPSRTLLQTWFQRVLLAHLRRVDSVRERRYVFLNRATLRSDPIRHGRGRKQKSARMLSGEKYYRHLMLTGAGENRTIVLEVLSVEPRVFDVHYSCNVEEAQGLIAMALAETSETDSLHRSTTGTAPTSVSLARELRKLCGIRKGN